jgi:diaminopimelate decarboxylase
MVRTERPHHSKPLCPITARRREALHDTMSGPVAGFPRIHGDLTADGVRLADVAAEMGTPLHVYSGPLIDDRFRAMDAAFAGTPHRIHYAIKANATLGIVRRLRSLGAGADANSSGEIEVALRAGFQPPEIVFTGVGKTAEDIDRAVALGVGAINAESFGEVSRIAARATALGREAAIAIRINPDVEAGSHPHISTGSHGTKFGVPLDRARAMIREIVCQRGLRLVGLHAHVGSQITRVDPLTQAAATLAALAGELAGQGIHLRHLDLGGGLGIPYEPGQRVVTPDEYAGAIVPLLRETGLTLVLEPGRWIVGPAGVLVTRVVDVKDRPRGGQFVIVDAGMTDLIRPALYGAWHGIEPVAPPRPGAIRADVVGPVCETSDTFAAERELPPLEVGDLLAIRDTGAYGAVMASNYNRRPMAAEALVDDRRARIIRRRQTVDEMLQWDV